MAEAAESPGEKQSREGAQRVASLVARNIEDSPQDARTCKIIIRNDSKFQLSSPLPFPMCCRSVGDPPPLDIPPSSEGSMNFSKPRWKPFGCSGLMSYKVGRKQRLVIMFRNPMFQLTQKSKSTAAVVMVSKSETIGADLYKDMAFNWDRSSYHKPGAYRPKPQYRKQIAADGQAELLLDDIHIKFYMTQDTNATLKVELLPGKRQSRSDK